LRSSPIPEPVNLPASVRVWWNRCEVLARELKHYVGTHLLRKYKEAIEPPNLIEVQANSYVDFLQKDVPYSKRKNQGLQAVFKEVFPIESYDEKAVLDFSHYDIVNKIDAT
jgi:DNA-directed RNA polymerase, beta subunit/140 kD subunit